MLELLLELGADVNLQAGNGETLLHLAVQNRDERAVTAIVKAGGDPAVKNSDGMSPLDMATQISERLVALMTPREEL